MIIVVINCVCYDVVLNIGDFMFVVCVVDVEYKSCSVCGVGVKIV